MMRPQMTGYSTQIHPIHIHLQCFLASLFIIDPRLGFRRVFDLAVHTAISLAATRCFSGSILPFGSLTFRTFVHASILAHFLATPYYSKGGFPFAYPPLVFYLEVILHSIFLNNRFLVENFLPPLISAVTLVSVFLLLRWRYRGKELLLLAGTFTLLFYH